jgi:hypothetical protein
MHYFSPLALFVMATYITHPRKISISRPGPPPFPAAGVLSVSFLPAQVKSQVIPRLLAAVTDTKLSKILQSVMTKVIDAKDDIVLHITKDESYKHAGNTTYAMITSFNTTSTANHVIKMFNFIIRDRCSSGMLLRSWLVVAYRRVGPTDRSHIQGKTFQDP